MVHAGRERKGDGCASRGARDTTHAVARNYTRDEVKTILDRALERQHDPSEAVSHDDLLAIGKEIGVAPDALEAAATGVREERRVEAHVEARIQRARRGFTGHALAFVMVNLMLGVANFVTAPVPWSLMVLLGWGIGLAFHARAAFWPDRARLAERARRTVAREQAREEALARTRELEASARKLGAAVQVGFAEVLSAAADAIDASHAKGAAGHGTGVRVDAGAEGAKAEAQEAEASAREVARRDRG
jgi:hypothetical protein